MVKSTNKACLALFPAIAAYDSPNAFIWLFATSYVNGPASMLDTVPYALENKGVLQASFPSASQ
jgi:hypothetical protein